MKTVGFCKPARYLVKKFTLALNQKIVSQFAQVSDFFYNRLQENYLVRAYYDSPRIIIADNTFNLNLKKDELILNTSVDIRKSNIRTIGNPGQNRDAEIVFNIIRGTTDAVLEEEVLNSFAPHDNRSFGVNKFLEMAAFQGASLRGITNLLEIESLSISPNAKVLITEALASNKIIVIPNHDIKVDSISRVAWYEINSKTGETFWVSEDGGHQGLTEYSLILRNIGTGLAGLGVGFSLGYALTYIRIAGWLNLVGDFTNYPTCEHSPYFDCLSRKQVKEKLKEEQGFWCGTPVMGVGTVTVASGGVILGNTVPNAPIIGGDNRLSNRLLYGISTIH